MKKVRLAGLTLGASLALAGTLASAAERRAALEGALRRSADHPSAVRAGALAARGDFIFLCDADLSMPIGELDRFVAEGLLDHVYVARSREVPDQRVYVQDLIREHGALVWRLINAGSYVYVCGSQPMRDSVRTAFVDVVGEHGSLPPQNAETLMHELETTENRYRPDVWG